jgi:hypothetical protein
MLLTRLDLAGSPLSQSTWELAPENPALPGQPEEDQAQDRAEDPNPLAY